MPEDVVFSFELNFGHIIAVCATVVASVGLFLNLSQLKRNTKIQRATLMKDLLSPLFNDHDIRAIFYKIEYGEFEYNFQFHNSEDEQKFDKLLEHFNMICELYFRSLLTKMEMGLFDYYLRRIRMARGLDDYFKFVDEFSKHVNSNRPFKSLRAYFKEIGT